jgi:hypothetical protein
LSWSSARPWRSRLTAGIAAARRALPWAQPLVRIAIHPPDILIPVTAKSAGMTLRQLCGRRELTTYQATVTP